jgi:DNA-binding NarL/FixJ family response regulator
MPAKAAVSILVADPHPITRAGVRAVLAAHADLAVVGETGYGPEVAALAEKLGSDVLVCETALLGAADLSLLRERGCRVLVLTASEDARTTREVLAAGAAGYLLKRATPDQLVQAVRVVAGGGTYLDPEVAGCVLHGPRDESGLSDREEQVIRLIALGYSNKEIAAQLRLSVKTVETYKGRSLEKLNVRTRVGLVEYAARRGWLNAADRAVVVG